jgi:thioredoxin reductase (NADPH)
MTRAVDLAIVGGGAAGLSAGLYAARSRIDAVLIERMGAGGQLINVDRVENYPGFPDGIPGHELGPLMAQQAMDAGLAFEYGEVTGLRAGHDGQPHGVDTDGESYVARAVILAGGSTLSRLGVPGESEFEGSGVSYCATCDGEFFRDQPVAVVGGGDSALDEALYLTHVASYVTIVHRRDAFRAEEIARERIRERQNCSVMWNSTVTRIVGGETVNAVEVQSSRGVASKLDVSAVFIYTGLTPNTAYLQGEVDVDPAGHVVTDVRLESSVPGIFAAGDLRQYSTRQVASSVGDGVTAAIWAERFLRGPLAR